MGYIDELTTIIKELKEEKSKLFDALKNTIEKLELVESERKELEEDWIPVTEDLPKNNFDVLITDGENYYVGWYRKINKTKGAWYSMDNRFDIVHYPIIAWKPINQYIPEEEEKKEKIAHWYFDPHGRYYICSSCKRTSETTSDICPHCNATMKEANRFAYF